MMHQEDAEQRSNFTQLDQYLTENIRRLSEARNRGVPVGQSLLLEFLLRRGDVRLQLSRFADAESGCEGEESSRGL